MKNTTKAVSLLLAISLMLTTIVGSDGVQAAKKTAAKVSSVKITNAGKTMRLQKGKTFKLQTNVTVKPNKSKYKKVKFTSSNRKVVLVNSRGKMKGVKVGTAKITAASRTNRKKKAVISVTVTNDVLVSSIKLNRTKITAEEYSEEEIPLKVMKILPSNAKNKEVVWSTDNEDVADVDDDGVVTTGEVGTATITAKAADKGGAFATCRVVVAENKSQGNDNNVETEKPPVQEEPGETLPPADVPTQEPGQSEVSPLPEEPEETASPEPGDVTAEPTEEPAEPMEVPTIEPTVVPTKVPTEKPTVVPSKVPTPKPEKTPKPEETQKPTPTPDPWTPAQDAGWVKLDLSQWSGGEGNYSETGDQLILDDTALGTLPLPTSLENVGDKVEVVVRGSVSEDSDGFRFWLVNEDQETRSGQYFYTSADGERYRYGESASDPQEKQIGEYKPGESFHIQTVFENVNWDNETDVAAISMLLKGPMYFEPEMSLGNMDGVTITGIWVRYGDKIGTTVEDPTIKPEETPKPTPTPDPWIPSSQDAGWVKLDLSQWSGGEGNYLETGDQLIFDDTELGTLPLPTSLENVGDKVEVLIRGSVSEDSDGFRFWLVNEGQETRSGQYSYTSADGELYRYGESFGDYEEKQIGEYKPGESFHIQTVFENVNWDNETDMPVTSILLKGPIYFEPEISFGNMDGVTITGIWVRYGDKIGTTVEDPTPSTAAPDLNEYELDLQEELWTNTWCEKISNPDGSVTLTKEMGDAGWKVGEFGFAVPRDVVGNQHKLTKIIIKYRDSDLTGTEIDETTDTCGYLFHLGDTDQVGWIDGEGFGTDPDFPESHQCSLLFNGTGETVITAGENEKNFSTIRIYDGKIGGKITIESIRLVKEELSDVETPKVEEPEETQKPLPTPDPWTPAQDAGWVKLDLSQWSGGEDNYSETGDQLIFGDTELGILPLPTSLENVGDKVEVLIRGSVSEDSGGFRFWLVNEDQETRSGQYFYTSADGERYRYGESASDPQEKQIGEYKPGESFHIQTVFENVNWDNETDMPVTSILLKGPIYFEPEISFGNMEGVTITGIWVRYGDKIETTVEDFDN